MSKTVLPVCLVILYLLALLRVSVSRAPDRFSTNSPVRRPARKEEEYSIYSFFQSQGDKNVGNSAVHQEKEQLYEAYNLLHTLAQDFHKPFDAPAVIVVGHQTSGKSALIEALMGFQFNQVGGGTKTRRPVALRMQYNPNCITPLCFLTQENGKEEQRSLAEIQAYIENENKRLERDSTRSFDPREISIRMEYRYCPNMIVIDTPGMLHPPKGRQLTAPQRALAQAAKEAESLVLSKISCEDYIILCVEDTTDWKHATTRNVVMQADPQLARTVLVTTKLDTKLPQFSEAEDLEDFYRAPLVHSMFSQLLGGPFFTSVPSGRVGTSKDFDTNDAFVHSLKVAERADRSASVARMGAAKARSTLGNVGVSRLRTFLEARVEDCYRRNVAKIVPVLQTELRHAEAKLDIIDEQLKSLSMENLRLMANEYREKFSRELSNAIQGSVKASVEKWGETLDVEAVKGGSFLPQGQVKSDAWQQLLETEVGSSQHKLFGGAQYHRAMREFTIAVRQMTTTMVTEDEIANAAGMGDRHNGVNFMRAACVIAMEKAQLSFEPMLEALRNRAAHIMKRMYPVVEEMIRRSESLSQASPMASSAAATSLGSHSAPFQQMMQSIYNKFVDRQLDACIERCRDDLIGMTRFVTWDVEDKGGASTLYRLLPTPQKMVEIYSIAVAKRQERQQLAQSLDVMEEADFDDLEDEDIQDFDVEEEEDEEDEEDEYAKRNNNRNRRGGKNTQKNSKNKGGKGGRDDSEDKIFADWKKANGPRKKRPSPKKVPVSNSEVAVTPAATQSPVPKEDDAELSDYYRVMQLTEEMISGTSASRTSALVTSLVQFITSSWRNHFARSVTMKFNCFFLMPFMDEFPAYLRNELDSIYESGVAEMFDIAETRRALQSKRAELLAECNANSKLQSRFDAIAAQLQSPSSFAAASAPSTASSSLGVDKPGGSGGVTHNDAYDDEDFLGPAPAGPADPFAPSSMDDYGSVDYS